MSRSNHDEQKSLNAYTLGLAVAATILGIMLVQAVAQSAQARWHIWGFNPWLVAIVAVAAVWALFGRQMVVDMYHAIRAKRTTAHQLN